MQKSNIIFLYGIFPLILEGVVILHETIYELHRNKMDRVLFKTNFEKMYDKVNWYFSSTSVTNERF
jgi:hypothetical protein